MSNTDLAQAVWDVAYLASCAVASKMPDRARVTAMDLDEVYRVAQRHLLVSACATSLAAADVHDERFVQAQAKALRKVALMDAERARLFARMDEAGIWHMPLKGCVLQGLYPAYGMRQMADNDILFDATHASEVRTIMEEQGFSTEHFSHGPHDVYHKAPVCNFELHRMLFGPSQEPLARRRYEYYRDVSRLLLCDDDATMGRHLSDEDFYVYLMAHEHKHFSGGGTGLRSLLDTYVFLAAKGQQLDGEHVQHELDILGLADFEAHNRALATHLFAGEPLSEGEQETLAYMVDSGSYGSMTHRVANQLATYGRLGYLVVRTFPSFESMATLYPVLDRAPLLLPVCWAWRLVTAVATKPRRVWHEISTGLSLRRSH